VFTHDKNPVGEPQFSSYLYVLYKAILQVRMRIRYGNPMPEDQLHDLMDAVHNIPAFLRQNSGWHVEENVRDDLERYDEKWGDTETEFGHFRLRGELDEAVERMDDAGQ